MWNYHGLGIALTELGRYQEAEVAMRRALDRARAMGSATDIRLLSEAAGWVAMRQDDWGQAVESPRIDDCAAGHRDDRHSTVHLARAYRGLGRLDDALATADHAVEISRKLGLVDNELRALIEVAQSQEAKGDLDGAHQTVSGVIDRLEAYRARTGPRRFPQTGVRRSLLRCLWGWRHGADAARARGRGPDGGRAPSLARLCRPAGATPRARGRRCRSRERRLGAWGADRRSPRRPGRRPTARACSPPWTARRCCRPGLAADLDHRRVLDSREGVVRVGRQPDGAIHAVDAARDAGRSAARRASGLRRCPGCLDRQSVWRGQRPWSSTVVPPIGRCT